METASCNQQHVTSTSYQSNGSSWDHLTHSCQRLHKTSTGMVDRWPCLSKSHFVETRSIMQLVRKTPVHIFYCTRSWSVTWKQHLQIQNAIPIILQSWSRSCYTDIHYYACAVHSLLDFLQFYFSSITLDTFKDYSQNLVEQIYAHTV